MTEKKTQWVEIKQTQLYTTPQHKSDSMPTEANLVIIFKNIIQCHTNVEDIILNGSKNTGLEENVKINNDNNVFWINQDNLMNLPFQLNGAL